MIPVSVQGAICESQSFTGLEAAGAQQRIQPACGQVQKLMLTAIGQGPMQGRTWDPKVPGSVRTNNIGNRSRHCWRGYDGREDNES